MSGIIDKQVATQTALDFIVEYLGGAFDEGLQRMLLERMNALLSAEPEIIRCKDCYHYPSKYADCPMIGWARNENDFCSKAERKDHD